MRFYIQTSNGYIISIGTGGLQGDTITQAAYDVICAVMKNAPVEDGYIFKLCSDLTWEKTESYYEEPDEISDTEALTIITGGET